MSEPEVLREGIVFGESPRWHDGQLWFSDWDRGAFACALSREQNPRLFVVGQAYGGPESPQPSGQVVAFPAPAPGAGRP